MKKIGELLFNRWVLGALIVIALSLVVLLVGDAVTFFDHRPLESALARWIFVLIIVLAWVAWELIRAWRIRRANQAMLHGIAGADPDAESSARSVQEIATLQARFKEAVTVLRKARFKGRTGERQYLYQLPWYVFVGAPGSGKTTALVNSGLKFPLEEAGGEQSIKGVGGTRNCDWWFTDEAVLLDTAGRYVTQDSEQKVDASAWQGFLALLKRFRPRQPLNGAIVTTRPQAPHPPRRNSMKRVTGIGGIVFRARDPAALRDWYRTHLGIDVQSWGCADGIERSK